MDNSNTILDESILNKEQLLDKNIESNKAINITDIINKNIELSQSFDLITHQSEDITNSENNIFEQLNTEQLSQVSQELNKFENLTDILNNNSILDRNSGWIGTSLEEVKTSGDSFGCDCPECCGAIAPDFDSTNMVSTSGTDTSLLAAASSEITKVPYSGNRDIDSLIYPAKWTSKTITYSFYDGGNGGNYYGGQEGKLTPLTNKVKNYLRDILENKIENLIDVDFVEVSDAGNNYGQIRYMFSDDTTSGYTKVASKYGTSPKGGDIFLGVSIKSQFEAGPGAYRYETLIHETLHALELKHPGNYNGSTNGGQSGTFLPYADDNSNNSVLSYNRLRNTSGYSGVITPMAYDIRALQYLYGAAKYHDGNTTYKFAKIDEYTVGGKFFGNRDSNSKQTIWDSGGVDTADFSQLKFEGGGYLFDLSEGGVITTQNAYLDTNYKARGDNRNRNFKATSRGTWLAYDMNIENVINSGSDDTMVANSAANTFGGYDKGLSTGKDVIYDANSQDTLDLSAYKLSELTTSKQGNDYVINLDNNSSVTVKDYYGAAAGDRLNILTSNGNPNPNPNPNPTNGELVWEEQGFQDDSAVATGSELKLGNGVTATVNWQAINKNGGTFAIHGKETDYVTYEKGRLGNHQGYLSLGFDNSNDDPDDLIKLSLDFNQAVAGLSFKLLDVDQAKGKAFDDGVEVYADGVNIKKLSGVEIITGDNVMADNEPYMNGFEGRGQAGANNLSEGGNINISFGSTEVSSLEIKYFSTDDAIANPNSQKIGLSDLDFQIHSA